MQSFSFFLKFVWNNKIGVCKHERLTIAYTTLRSWDRKRERERERERVCEREREREKEREKERERERERERENVSYIMWSNPSQFHGFNLLQFVWDFINVYLWVHALLHGRSMVYKLEPDELAVGRRIGRKADNLWNRWRNRQVEWSVIRGNQPSTLSSLLLEQPSAKLSMNGVVWN